VARRRLTQEEKQAPYVGLYAAGFEAGQSKAVNLLTRLGLAPDTAEEKVEALVVALREVPDMDGCCDTCDAKMVRRNAALAPFEHLLGGEP
jgi:hypothetical protein